MQDHHRPLPLTASLPICGAEDGRGIVMVPPVSQPCEGAVIGEDYVQMLLNTIREHDAEKLSLLQRINDCIKPEQAEVQRLRQEITQKDQELAQLRQDISEKRLMLQEERERSNRLLHESTVQHAQAEDDRARIASLLRLRHQWKSAAPTALSPDATAVSGGWHAPHSGDKSHSPPVDTTAAATGRRGSSSQRRRSGGGGGGTMSLRQAVLNQQSAASSSKGDALPPEAEAAVQEALRPPPSSSLVTALSEEVRMLQEQLDAQRSTYEHERAKRLHEERECTRQHAEEVERYIATIDHLHSLHQTSLADLIRSRHDMQIEQRQLRGMIEKLRVSLDEALTALEEERRRHSADLQLVQQRTDDSVDTVMRRLRQELEERRALAMAEKEQHAALIATREAELVRLRETLKKERQRQHRLEERHRLEMEGVNSEVNLMRQALRAMEKRVYYSQSRGLSV